MSRLRTISFAVAVTAVLAAPSAALAQVTPGAYKGSLYKGTTKLANAPATMAVAGTKVTISAPRFPVECQAADGTFKPQGSEPFTFKGVVKGTAVVGKFPAPSGEVLVYEVNGRFSGSSFVGKLTYSGRCRGAANIRTAR